jgi:tripeptide aminopeptidase
MSTSEQELLSLFLRLAPIEGVSHAERAIADEVTTLLRQGGIRVVEDNAACIVKGNTGNLLCFPPAFDEHAPAILLEAHLDTVQSTAALKAIVKPDRVTSDGSTILGADNRMGLSLLVDLLLKVAKTKAAHRNFFVALTVCEETGLYGADAIDLTSRNVTAAYVFDCSKRPGIYIRESVGLYAFTAHFIGKAAHAGVAPEEGISAIALSAAAISKIQVGRIDSDTTANIGKIYGGEATNVVPDKVTIEGEVRSFFPERIKEELDHIRRSFEAAVGGAGRVQFNAVPDFEPYVHKPESAPVLHLESALRAAGLDPQPIRYMGGSDANKYNAKGIPAVNIGIGAQKPHSVEEFFLLEDLYKSSRIANELIQIR